MTALRPIAGSNKQLLPLDTTLDEKAIARADKVRHDAPVPGTTDNSSEDWAAHLGGAAGAAEEQITSLQNRTSDLHAPPPATGWTDALADNSEGGVAVRRGSWNLAQARAATYAVSLDTGLDGRMAVRLRAGTDPRQARVEIQGRPGQSFFDSLTNFQFLGSSADEVWDYYGDVDTLGSVTLLLLQLTSSAVHIGQSVFRGEFDGEFSDRVQSELASPQPDGHLDARVGVLEDKTSRIDFDEEGGTSWAPADNRAVGGRHPYGQWAWIADGNDPLSYGGRDYDSDFTALGGSGFAGGGSGLLWVLPNNISWDHVRLTVTAADGTVKNRIRGQDLRNAPAAIVVANLPTDAPEVTVRWTASSDTSAYAIANIAPTDTIDIEELGPTHEPIWEGEYRPESISLAALTPQVIDFINQYELAQTRVEITDNPPPLTVFFDSETTVREATEPVAPDAGEVDLAHAIRIANATGLHRGILLSATVGLYLQQNTNVRTSGSIQTITLHMEVAGKSGSGVELFTRNFTLADFLAQRDAAGLNTYSASPDLTVAIDERLIDVRTWDVDDGDRIQFRLHGNIFNGHARVQARFTDFRLVHDRSGASLRNLPTLPDPGDRDAKVLKFAGNELGYHPVISPQQVLASVRFANRGNANNFAWEASSSALDGGVTTSGTTLTFDARKVVASGTLGIFVIVSRHTPIRIISQVFLPWSAFRTGDGTYVTNAVAAITQGHFAGFWDDTVADSTLIARLVLNATTGMFDFSLMGAHADAASRLEIATAA